MNKWWIIKLKGNDPVYIYAMIDPRNGRVFYVGKTRGKLRDRLNGHTSDATRGNNSKKARHIREILKHGIKPEITLLETTNMNDYPARERYWIAEYKRLGYTLDNSDNGGGGFL